MHHRYAMKSIQIEINHYCTYIIHNMDTVPGTKSKCLKLFSKVSKSVIGLEIKSKVAVSFVIFKTESLMCKIVRLILSKCIVSSYEDIPHIKTPKSSMSQSRVKHQNTKKNVKQLVIRSNCEFSKNHDFMIRRHYVYLEGKQWNYFRVQTG